jgi:hypothetical protein
MKIPKKSLSVHIKIRNIETVFEGREKISCQSLSERELEGFF